MRVAAAALAALALAAPAGAAAPFHLRLLAPTHRPRATAAWPYAVVVTDAAGRLLPARIHLQITLGGLPVGQVGRHATPGFWAETLEWPQDAVGQAVTLEVDATAAGRTQRVLYPVTTQPGPAPKVPRALHASAAGSRLAAAVGNLHRPRAASLAVRASGRLTARWLVTCNRAKGPGTISLGGVAHAVGSLRRALAIPPDATGDCAVGAVATAAGRVTVTLAGR